MASENTPLLQSNHDLVYERFSPQKKRFLVAVVSWGLLVACKIHFAFWWGMVAKNINLLVITTGVFIPSIPQIVRDLNTTGEVVKYVHF